MKPKKRRRRKKYTVMILTNSMEQKVKQISFSLGVLRLLQGCFALLVLAVAGLCVWCVYNPKLPETHRVTEQPHTEQTEDVEQLLKEKESLEEANRELSEQVSILSNTINQKVQEEEAEEAELAELRMPSGFPVTGSVSIVNEETFSGEETEGDEQKEPILVLKGSEGNLVVASGNGVVKSIEPDADYGNKIFIDHGNGYVSVYRNAGEPRVKTGEEVVRGTTLILMGADNVKVGYQIMQEETYINPDEILEING